MRFIDDQGESPPRQLADLRRDHRELLQRGDDDRLARLQRLLELARSGVDVLHHSQRLLELADGALQLAVEHAPVGDDDDGIEHAPIGCVVQSGELVSEPGDGEALAAAGGVLDQIALSHAAAARIGDQAAYAVELLVARKDHVPPPGLAARLVFLLHLMDELAHEVEDAIARPGLLPEIVGGVAGVGRWDGWVTGTAELASVEGQKAGLRPGEVSGDVDQIRVDGEVGETPAMGEQRLPRVAVGPVLPDRILDGLPRQWVLQLDGEDRQAR